MLLRRWLPVVLLTLLATSASAATYYADPEKGNAANDGSAAAPWPGLEACIQAGKLGQLKGGDTLLLRSGFHGEAKWEGENADFVTVAAEAGQAPKLARLEISQGKKWIVRGLEISPSYAKEPYKGTIASIGERGESTELVLENCFVHTAPDSSKWTKEEWMKAHSGILQGRHGTKLTLRNNYVLNTRFGINLCSFDSLCEGNVIANFSGDGIRVTRDGITVQYNVVKNAYVSQKEGDDNHDDGIQCFLFNKGTGTVRNVTLRGNIIINKEDDNQPLWNTMQAIGFFDGPLVDFLVENNVVMVVHWHGVSLYDAQNCKILNNTCYTKWKDEKPKPWVMLGEKKNEARGNTVKGNRACSFNFKADPQVVAEDNEPVTEEYFNQKLKETESLIAEKFGRYHPVAKYARLGMEKGENAPAVAAVPAGEQKAAAIDAKAAALAPVVPAASALTDEALRVWKERLIARLAEATKDGARPEAYLKVFGAKPEALKVVAASSEELKVSVQGNTMPVAWAKLDREDCYQAARALGAEPAAADLALQAVWARAAGHASTAEELLAKARQGGAGEAFVTEAAALLAAK